MTMDKVRIKWNITPALLAMEAGSKKGLELASEAVLAMANIHVPYRSGHLESTGKVDWDGERASVYYDTPYAVKLHQDRRLHIRNGREGQWLRKAAMKSRSVVLPLFAGGLKMHFGKGPKLAG